jgi:Flp pilus assembly protein TadD
MKNKVIIEGGLSQSPQRAQRRSLEPVLFSKKPKCFSLSLRTLRLCEKNVFVFGLAMYFALFTGCATHTNRVTQQSVPSEGPSVARLADGRQGFVIRESAGMDNESRDEFESAVALMNDGKNDKAIELLTKVVGRTPGVTAPHINIAKAYMRTGKPGPAEQHLKTALELVPNHPVASNEYGLLLRKGGRFKESREVYEKALASFPDYLPVRRNLGILCDLYLNDPECALKQFELYSAEMPGDAQVKIWIGELNMRLEHK